MNSFKDFGITTTVKGFIGDSIKMSKILNRSIVVFDFKIGPSKYPEKGNGMCLELQIEFDGEKRVVFTGSVFLQDTIRKVPETSFPFSTTIKNVNDHYEFS